VYLQNASASRRYDHEGTRIRALDQKSGEKSTTIPLYGAEFATLRMHSSMLCHEAMVTVCAWRSVRVEEGLISNDTPKYQRISPSVLLILRVATFAAGFTI